MAFRQGSAKNDSVRWSDNNFNSHHTFLQRRKGTCPHRYNFALSRSLCHVLVTCGTVRESLHVKRNTDVPSRNYCCLVKVISYIFPCVCVCVRVYMGGCVRLRACSLANPACNVPPYCHLRPLWFDHIFSTFSHKRHDFRKKLLNIKRVF